MMQGDNSRDSNIENAFLKLVQEIEKEYRNMPKAMRIRVEKWLEKLVLTGSNAVWRKTRNAYARLLLDMVISKRLTEPFHQLPPDGPLPSFPSHIHYQKGRGRELLGPHESMFWRELYHKMEDINEKSQYYRGGTYSEHPPYSLMDHAHFSREISNLNLVVKEQKIKIDLLEQQLKEERARHELEIQRMLQVHRMELTRVLAKASQVASRAYSPPTSPRRNSHTSQSFTSVPGRSGFEPSSFRDTSFVNESYKATKPVDPAPNAGLNDTWVYERSKENHPNHILSASFQDFPHSSDDEKKDVDESRHSIASRSKAFTTNSVMDTAQISTRMPGADIFPSRSFSEGLPAVQTAPPPASGYASSTDEEFLAYLDGFQTQLNKAQVDTSLTVAAIQDTLQSTTIPEVVSTST